MKKYCFDNWFSLCATYHNSFVDDIDGSEKQPNHQNTSLDVKRELEKCGANRFDGIEQPPQIDCM